MTAKPKAAQTAGVKAKATVGREASKRGSAAKGRPSLLRGEVLPGKQGAEQWVAAGGLNLYPESTAAAARRLLTDLRASSCWQNALGAVEFEEAVHCYHLAVTRDAWSGKTNRERRAWKDQFNKTLSRLIELMPEGPTPPDRYGFPVRDYVLMEVLRRVGHPLPSSSDTEAFFREMFRLNDATAGLPWAISDVLLDYQKQVEFDFSDSILTVKKPRDAKAGRAEFIVNFRHYSACTVPVVAAVAATMFNDDAIDERLVRRLTSTRADS